jgi:hypothetical protein
MPSRHLPIIAPALALVVALGLGPAARPDDDASDADAGAATVSFSKQIQPIFEARCNECHGRSEPELGLVLVTWAGTMAGSEYGSVVEPGDPDASLIVSMIANGDMPQEGEPMPAEELDLLRAWIREGAADN